MGLDMYLTKKTYIGAEYDHRKITGTIDIKENGKPVPIQFDRVSYIHEAVGYWRKANQIHRWFVENVQAGEDNCKEYDVEKAHVIKLLEICNQIKANCPLRGAMIVNGHSSGPESGGNFVPNFVDGKTMENAEYAAKLLPAAKGFFFGSTDYNQYYMDDINSTIEILTKILKEADPAKEYFSFDLIYSSSW